MKAELNIKIDVNIPGFPEMASAAHAFALRMAGISGASAPVTAQKTQPEVAPPPAVTQQAPTTTAPVTTQQQAPITTAPVSEAVPQQQAPTTAPPKYALPQLQAGTAQLVKEGKREEGLKLLGKYNIKTVLDLKEEQFGAFATDLRALGVKI